MKVVHLGIGLLPVPPPENVAAGREQYIYRLAEYLCRQGCSTYVLDIKADGKSKELRAQSSARYINIRRLPMPRRYPLPIFPSLGGHLIFALQEFIFGLSVFLPLTKFMAGEKVDIIHTHQRGAAIFAVFANKLRRSPAIVFYTPQLSTRANTWFRKLAHSDEIIALKCVDHIIALTPAYKLLLISEYGISPDKITPIHVGAATDEIRQFLRGKTILHKENMVLCVGAIVRRKNQLTAVKALAIVMRTYPDIKLVFAGPIGDESYLAEINHYIAENGLTGNVEIRGAVDRSELYRLYSEARLFLFPTKEEVQPTVVMDALAFGLPIVASNIGPNAEIIRHQPESAVLVDPDDIDGFSSAILNVVGDHNIWQKMAQAAEALAEIFSYKMVAGDTCSLYRELLKAKKTGFTK